MATGEPVAGLRYKVSFGNNISQLGITAAQLTRDIAVGASVWWMPTSKEFGPRGGFGDWESHEDVATRFGISSVRARESHYTPLDQPPGSTQIRIADGTPLFDTGALAPGVTLQNATYWVVSADVGLKFRGLFIQAEYSARWLYDFVGNGPVPVSELFDQSFYLQIAAYPIKHWWELYNATSFVFGDPKAGFHTNWGSHRRHECVPGAHALLPAVRALHLRERVCRRWNVRLLRRRRTGADYLGGREHLLLRWWQWRLRVGRRR